MTIPNLFEGFAERKRCRGCRETKPVSAFSLNGKRLYSRCKACRRPVARARYLANPDRYREGTLLRRYGLSEQEYEDLLAAQNGRCAICDSEPTDKRLSVDHDHDTGLVRGLLCSRCNIAVGHLEGIVPIFGRLFAYLKSPPAAAGTGRYVPLRSRVER